jgi:hypothetical protein
LAAALIAGCCTPRGLWTFWDSLRIVLPPLAADGAMFASAEWTPLGATYGSSAQIAWLILSVIALVRLFFLQGRSFWALAIAWLLAQLAVWTAASNLPPAAVWIAFAMALTTPQPVVAGVETGEARRARFGAWLVPLGLLAGVIVLLGGPREIERRMGWGIDARLDYRFLELALDGIQPQGSAFADNLRSAGMLAWLRPGEILVQDIPQRSLLGGRLRSHLALLDDLRRERTMSYRRANGADGGWWIPLARRKTTLLLVSSDDLDLIGALEPTLWKPLSLDSPVLPYASTGDPAYTERILQTLQQRHLAGLGPWSYSPPQTSGSPFDRDRWGWRPQVADRRASLHQAQVFRAMGLPRAALRILRYEILQGDAPELRSAQAQCQSDLAYREFVHAGRTSRFRAAATAPAQTQENWKPAIEAYLAGKLERALELLAGADPEARYARASILVEAGDPAAAQSLLTELAQEPSGYLPLLARHLQQSLPFRL